MSFKCTWVLVFQGFVCQHCGKNFRHKSNLNRHLSYCDPEKQAAEGFGRFSCELCDKTYLRKESLTEHKISKHSSVTFECNVCGKVYDSRGSLFWHRTKSLCAKGITSGEPTARRKKKKQEPLKPHQSAAQVLQPPCTTATTATAISTSAKRSNYWVPLGVSGDTGSRARCIWSTTATTDSIAYGK